MTPGPVLGAGVFATAGALAASLAPQGGPLRDRLRRVAAATGFGGLGLVVGQFAAGGGWLPVVLIAVLSALAALLSAVNAALPPSAQRQRRALLDLPDPVRATTLALDGFVEAAFAGSPADRRRARRRTYRALTELQTRLQRRLAEPPPISTRAAAWWPVIVQLERTAAAVTEAVIAIRGGEPVPDLAQVAVLRRALQRLEDDVRAHRTPDDAEIHAEGVLAPGARRWTPPAAWSARSLPVAAAPARPTPDALRVARPADRPWDGPGADRPDPLAPAGDRSPAARLAHRGHRRRRPAARRGGR